MKEITVGKNEAGQRLDKLLIKFLPDAGKGFIYKMMRKKNITLNDKKCTGNELLNVGDSVKLWFSDETLSKLCGHKEIQKTAAPLEPVFENDDIVVFNKPAGMLSQKARDTDVSVNEALISYLLTTGQIDSEQLMTFRPSICNRLDRNTSGLIICGKSLKGLQETAELLRDRTAHKDYIAVVKGVITEGRRLNGYLSKDSRLNLVTVGDEGDRIETEFKPLYTDGKSTYIMVRLVTGKTHQIRAHLAAIGHPLLGDVKYGDGKGAHRQLLHAYRFTLPDRTVITAQPPEDMKWELGNPEAFEDLPWRI